MNEQEAIEFLTGYLDSVVYKEKCVEAHKLAIKALEEIQQYREIGTPEECRAAVEKQKEIRNQAIDDFKAEVENLIIDSSVLRMNDIEEIAEQLKGGGVNA